MGLDLAGKKSILRASIKILFFPQKNIIKKGLGRFFKFHYFNITVTLSIDLKEILPSTSKIVFWKVSNKSSEVGKKQNEEKELSNFREWLRNNYLIKHFFNYGPTHFVYSNIF